MKNSNVVLSSISLVASIVSIFVMYYIFAGIALVLGLLTVNDEKSKKLSLSSIAIVCITLVVKIIYNVVTNGSLPGWLSGGLL